MKIQLEQVDLLEPWPTLVLKEGYRAMNVLVRIGSAPVGEIMARPARKRILSHRRLQRRIVSKLSFEILQTLVREGMAAGLNAFLQPTGLESGPPLAGEPWHRSKQFVRDKLLSPEGLKEPLRSWVIEGQARTQYECPPVTVVVCTRDRATQLQRCIASLLELDYPHYEILVCDNSRDPRATREVCGRMEVDYVREPVAGLSRARNTALRNARTRWVAFTDDDCVPDKNWLKELVRPLQDSHCRCVCGLVRPAQLESAAEITFEIYGGLGRGFRERFFDVEWLNRSLTKAPATWQIGAGANMLLDRDAVLKLGGYVPDLGPGGVGGCGEDTLVFYQLLRERFSIHYAPRAMVHHYHRTTDAALRRHIHSYAVGHAAYLWHTLFAFRDYRAALRLGWYLPAWFVKNWRYGVRGWTRYPHSLVRQEIKGTINGPIAYSWAILKKWLSGRATIKRNFNVPGPRLVPMEFDEQREHGDIDRPKRARVA